MSANAERVLTYLRKWGGCSQHQLGLALDLPEPSVRRLVRELRHEGHNITFTTGRDACYRLLEQAPAEGQGADAEEF